MSPLKTLLRVVAVASLIGSFMAVQTSAVVAAEQQGPTCEARAYMHCCECPRWPNYECRTLTDVDGDSGCTTTLCESGGCTM